MKSPLAYPTACFQIVRSLLEPPLGSSLSRHRHNSGEPPTRSFQLSKGVPIPSHRSKLLRAIYEDIHHTEASRQKRSDFSEASKKGGLVRLRIHRAP